VQIETGNYTAIVTNGLLKLLQIAERHLTVVTVTADTTEVKAVPYSAISPSLSASPLLTATWAGAGYAHVDLDCGAQRWNGTKSMMWLRKGLYRAGFSKENVDALFRQMRLVGPQDHVGRSW